MLVPISATSAPPTTKPAVVPSDRPGDVLAGAERVGAQHRERSEDHPEPVLHRGDVGDEHRQREAGAPRRLLCSHDELGSACASARSRAELSGPVKPEGWRPSSRCSQVRRAAAAAKSTLAAICSVM